MHAFAIQNEAQYQTASSIADQQIMVSDDHDRSGLLLCHASGPLISGSSAAERLLVVVHGALRNSDLYLAHAKAAAGAAGAATLIVAPQFLADVDLHGRKIPPASLYWDVESWKGGGPAIGPEPVSSFSAMDSLLRQLTESRSLSGKGSLPVVIIGNSAGGQYVNRYAAVGRAPDWLAKDGIQTRFVIANPSTYLYFDKWRPVDVSEQEDVNRWRYGFNEPPPYVDSSPEECLQRYVERDVTIVLGAEDRDADALLLEVSAAAMAQGANRLERGLNYAQHVRTLAGEAGLTGQHKPHRLVQLAGVGHDAGRVLAAPETREILFG
jgi:hypothetical protein